MSSQDLRLAVTGDESDNTLYGYQNNDTIEGGKGNDKLNGEYGDDTIINILILACLSIDD